MLRKYVELQQRLRDLVAAESGTTVPEYMLVLGFISLILIVAFNATGIGNDITAMGTLLGDKINP